MVWGVREQESKIDLCFPREYHLKMPHNFFPWGGPFEIHFFLEEGLLLGLVSKNLVYQKMMVEQL